MGCLCKHRRKRIFFLNILNARIASTRTGHLFTCAVYPLLIQKLSEIEKNNNFSISKGYKKKWRNVEEKSSSLFHVHNVNCLANGLRDILDGRVLPWMSFMHCSPHQSKVKGNFCKVYSVNCFGQTGKRLKPTNDYNWTGKRLKPTNDYNWQHRRVRFLKNQKLNTFILLPDALSSHVCSIIYLFSVKYRYSYSLLIHKLWNRKKITISECLLIGGETETFQLITLVVCCSYFSNLIGRRTINIPETILGVHGLMGFTVKLRLHKRFFTYDGDAIFFNCRVASAQWKLHV